MGELNIYEKIKGFVGGLGFDIFLWSHNMTQDEYINSIIEQEPCEKLITSICNRRGRDG